MANPQHIRVFLSSPGDVTEERQAADELLASLPREAAWQGKFTIEIVRWDDPHRPATMDAHLKPQQAVDSNKPRPSECEITVVILWSRMGTPFVYNGRRYLSGTEYEYEDALEGEGCVLVYRRTDPPEAPAGDWRDPSYDNKLSKHRHQLQLVDEFFKRFVSETGEPRGSYVSYHGLAEFKRRLRQDVENVLANSAATKEFVKDNLISADRARQIEESAILARSLDAEIGMIQTRVSQLHRRVNGLLAQKDDEAHTEVVATVLRDVQQRFPNQVYEANASRLGLLHPVIAKRVVHYYTNVEWIAEKQSSLTDTQASREDMRNLAAKLLGATFMLHMKGETLQRYLAEFAHDPRLWSPPDDETDASETPTQRAQR